MLRRWWRRTDACGCLTSRPRVRCASRAASESRERRGAASMVCRASRSVLRLRRSLWGGFGVDRRVILGGDAEDEDGELREPNVNLGFVVGDNHPRLFVSGAVPSAKSFGLRVEEFFEGRSCAGARADAVEVVAAPLAVGGVDDDEKRSRSVVAAALDGEHAVVCVTNRAPPVLQLRVAVAKPVRGGEERLGLIRNLVVREAPPIESVVVLCVPHSVVCHLRPREGHGRSGAGDANGPPHAEQSPRAPLPAAAKAAHKVAEVVHVPGPHAHLVVRAEQVRDARVLVIVTHTASADGDKLVHIPGPAAAQLADILLRGVDPNRVEAERRHRPWPFRFHLCDDGASGEAFVDLICHLLHEILWEPVRGVDTDAISVVLLEPDGGAVEEVALNLALVPRETATPRRLGGSLEEYAALALVVPWPPVILPQRIETRRAVVERHVEKDGEPACVCRLHERPQLRGRPVRAVRRQKEPRVVPPRAAKLCRRQQLQSREPQRSDVVQPPFQSRKRPRLHPRAQQILILQTRVRTHVQLVEDELRQLWALERRPYVLVGVDDGAHVRVVLRLARPRVAASHRRTVLRSKLEPVTRSWAGVVDDRACGARAVRALLELHRSVAALRLDHDPRARRRRTPRPEHHPSIPR
mmetsp:Transcript_9146/g.30101  ORF Transcript_9146/g.30101 Transcript_9146/m.30101 type:complete len:640 (+) Transcript_9146:49-1968(+)